MNDSPSALESLLARDRRRLEWDIEFRVMGDDFGVYFVDRIPWLRSTLCTIPIIAGGAGILVPIYLFRPQFQILVAAMAVGGVLMIAILWLMQLAVVQQARISPPLLEYRASTGELVFESGETQPAAALRAVRVVRGWTVNQRRGSQTFVTIAQLSCAFCSDENEWSTAVYTLRPRTRSLGMVAEALSARLRVPLEQISVRASDAILRSKAIALLGSDWK